jgi:beta-mannosidase
VPGDIISDLQRAGLHNPPFEANSALFETEWLNASARALWQAPNRDWTYSKRFVAPADAAYLVLGGVKMGAHVRLNGIALGTALDQWLRYTFPIRAILNPVGEENLLQVAFTNKLDHALQGRYMSVSGYNVPGSDWTPLPNPFGSSVGINIPEACNVSIVPLEENLCFSWTYGIWKSVSLLSLPEAAPAAIQHLQLQTFYQGPYPTQALTGQTQADFVVAVRVHFLVEQPCSGTLNLIAAWGAQNLTAVSLPAGESAVNVTLHAAARNYTLWWPNNMGSQQLYNVTATFRAAGTATTAVRRIGFRVLNLVTVNDTNATERAIAQRSEGSGSHTMMFRVNGSPLHARGGNMIPMEMFEARLSADAYRRLVISAAEGGFNMLRVWGGGSFYHDAFFDAADEHGVLIYHDMQYNSGESADTAFPTATNPSLHFPMNSSMQERELRYQIRRLSHHASIAMWDSCNECNAGTDNMIESTGIHFMFVMDTVASEDRSRPVWPSSPSFGWAAGVNRLTGLPTGSPLVPGRGPPRPPGLHDLESHGPYVFGSGWSTRTMGWGADNCTRADQAGTGCNFTGWEPIFTPSMLGEMASPIRGERTSVAPYYVGANQYGWYRSEFGCSSFPSFESLSGMLLPEHWGAHTPPMRQRNHAADHIIFSYFGKAAAAALDEVGSFALKRATYQSMLAAGLYIKNEVESYRASNNWGTTFWQYNEIWPTGGWGSIEYGSPNIPGTVLGGRWKLLHYFLRRSVYRNVMGTCNRQGQCYVRNDGRFAFSGRLKVSLVRFATGETIEVGRHHVELPPGAGQIGWYCASPSQAVGWQRDEWSDDTVAGAKRRGSTSAYPALYGMLPADRAKFSKRMGVGSGSNLLSPCIDACNASAACTGFTVTPSYLEPSTCWLYSHVESVVYGTGAVAQTAFYHKAEWIDMNFSYLAALAPGATARPASHPPILAHALGDCTAVCEADPDCNGFTLGSGTPISPAGNCSFFSSPVLSLVEALSPQLPLTQRESYFLKPGQAAPRFPTVRPPPPPKPPPAYPRPTGPSCEPLSVVQARNGCTNQTCMLVVEVEPAAESNATSEAEATGTATYNELLLAPPSGLILPAANVSLELGALGTYSTVPITLRTNATALFVTLTTQAAGRFSDNAILLVGGEPTTIKFLPWLEGASPAANTALLRRSLRVEHLQQYLVGSVL